MIVGTPDSYGTRARVALVLQLHLRFPLDIL